MGRLIPALAAHPHTPLTPRPTGGRKDPASLAAAGGRERVLRLETVNLGIPLTLEDRQAGRVRSAFRDLGAGPGPPAAGDRG